jgi:hypothetical protein
LACLRGICAFVIAIPGRDLRTVWAHFGWVRAKERRLWPDLRRRVPSGGRPAPARVSPFRGEQHSAGTRSAAGRKCCLGSRLRAAGCGGLIVERAVVRPERGDLEAAFPGAAPQLLGAGHQRGSWRGGGWVGRPGCRLERLTPIRRCTRMARGANPGFWFARRGHGQLALTRPTDAVISPGSGSRFPFSSV